MSRSEIGGEPTVRRIMLGAQLRRLREAAGVSREDAGWAIRASESKISRVELGKVGFKERDVADLLSLYGVDDERERSAVLTLLRQANEPGWWHRYNDVLPGWFQSYVGLEGAAVLIRAYEVQFVPGLLQVEQYARELIALSGAYAPAADVERMTHLRMQRRHVLTDPGSSTQLWAVIDEAALRRPIGGRAVMRAQLEYLIDASKQPNVTLQVLPFDWGARTAIDGPFSILRFDEEDLPNVVYLEQLSSALYLDKHDDIDTYTRAMDRLAAYALTPKDTVTILNEILDHHYRG